MKTMHAFNKGEETVARLVGQGPPGNSAWRTRPLLFKLGRADSTNRHCRWAGRTPGAGAPRRTEYRDKGKAQLRFGGRPSHVISDRKKAWLPDGGRTSVGPGFYLAIRNAVVPY